MVFKYASSLHTYDTRYAASQNLYKTRVRTNTGKQTISYMASIFCGHNIPPYMKNLNVYQFSKQIKLYLFSEQLENSWNIWHFEHFTSSNVHCSCGSVYLLVFVPYLLISLHPLILFYFARKRQGNNSKTARFFHSPGSTLSLRIS